MDYEWWMFRETCELLRHQREHSATRNALIESLAIHGRTLIEFFYLEDHHHWNLSDLGKKPIGHQEVQGALKQWRDATDEYVAHLTEARVNKLGDELLPVRAVTAVLEKHIERIRTKCAAALPANWIGNRPTTRVGPDDGSDLGYEGGRTGAAGP